MKTSSSLSKAHSEVIAELKWAGQQATSSQLVIGSGGNLSARIPDSETFVITASGTWLDTLKDEDFSLVSLDGNVIAGNPAASSELRLHLASYRARADVNAVFHFHPQASVLLDALGHKIRLMTIDHVFYVREIQSTPWIPAGSEEIAVATSEALESCNVVILGHHGCTVVADSMELAYKRAANLEEAASATLKALLLGDTSTECPPAYRALLENRADIPDLRDRH
jgi:L-fuculose-phosphate aldolase